MHVDAYTAIATVGAPFIGSFLAVVSLRLPSRRPVVLGRSSCDVCQHALAATDLLPLASFVTLRGKCRYCDSKISWVHPAMELASLVLVGWASLVVSGWILFASCLLGWTLLTLVAIDWRDGLLPDVLTLPLIVGGLFVTYANDPASIWDHFIGAAVGFLICALLTMAYRKARGRDGLGLGDAKLLSGSGAWLGWIGLPSVVLFAAGIGLALVLARRLVGERIDSTTSIPFGPALAAATWLVWLYGPLVPTRSI